jgi:outer membrane immunogenic protein
MKLKQQFIAAILMLTSGSILSQSPLPLGQTQINVGLGFSDRGFPFYIGLDHSIHKDITIGAEFSYRAYREKWNSNYYRHNVMGFSGNLNYHFNSILKIPQNWDFYAGGNVGFFVWSSPDDYNGNRSSGLGFGGQVGGRYYFSNRVGLNLEFGGGNAFRGGKVGLTFKI